MKTQISKPSAGKTLFTAEYKEEAVNHWKESGRSAATVAAELGIRAPLLYRWAQQLRLTAQQGGQPELKTAARVAALEGRRSGWGQPVACCAQASVALTRVRSATCNRLTP